MKKNALAGSPHLIVVTGARNEVLNSTAERMFGIALLS
jgi:hypothetical protein